MSDCGGDPNCETCNNKTEQEEVKYAQIVKHVAKAFQSPMMLTIIVEFDLAAADVGFNKITAKTIETAKLLSHCFRYEKPEQPHLLDRYTYVAGIVNAAVDQLKAINFIKYNERLAEGVPLTKPERRYYKTVLKAISKGLNKSYTGVRP